MTSPARPAATPARVAFPSLRIRLGEDRFELWLWDGLEAFTVLLGLGLFGLPFLALLSAKAAAAVGLLGLLVMAGMRQGLVVTRAGAWEEHRVLGLCYRRLPLGLRPEVWSGLVWDWSELSVVPREKPLRAPLHDEERAVLAEWGDDPHKERDGDRLAELVRQELERLHPPLPPQPPGSSSEMG